MTLSSRQWGNPTTMNCKMLLFILILSVWILISWRSMNKYIENSPSESQLRKSLNHQDTTKGDLESNRILNFLVVGDFGTGKSEQYNVSKSMEEYSGSLNVKPSFVLSTGDQVYDHGIVSPEDPQLQSKFENVYNTPHLNIPWYISIGNHDCEGSIPSMLEYAKMNPKWKFPSRYYYFDQKIGESTLLRILVLDTCDLVCGAQPGKGRCMGNINGQTSLKSKTQQYQWIQETLNLAPPKGIQHLRILVVGHWGIYSFVGNGHTHELISNLNPILKEKKVIAYFSGHDHCLQHIRYDTKDDHDWKLNYFVSGAGGYRIHPKIQSPHQIPELQHVSMKHGFMAVTATESKMQIQFVSHDGDKPYSTEILFH